MNKGDIFYDRTYTSRYMNDNGYYSQTRIRNTAVNSDTVVRSIERKHCKTWLWFQWHTLIQCPECKLWISENGSEYRHAALPLDTGPLPIDITEEYNRYAFELETGYVYDCIIYDSEYTIIAKFTAKLIRRIDNETTWDNGITVYHGLRVKDWFRK